MKLKDKTKFRKKGFTPQEVLIGIIITVISFYLVLAFIVSNKEFLVSNAQDLQCRATIESKAMSTVNTADEISKRVGIDSFLNVLNDKCHTDYLKIDTGSKNQVQSRDEVYKKVADEQARCWYRYGEGKADFLSSFGTSGNWCFPCGVITVKSNEGFEYKYSDYADWLSKNEYKKEKGKSIKYSEYFKIKYTTVSDSELQDINSELQELMPKDGDNDDPSFMAISSVVAGQYQSLADMKLKKISSQEPVYVVFRYDRIDKSFEKQMGDATKGAIVGVGMSIVAGAVIEGVTVGLVTGPGGVIAFFRKLATSTVKAAESTAKVLRLQKISAKISSLIKGSNKIEKELVSLEKFSASLEEMKNIQSSLKASNKIEDAEKVKTIISTMEELGFKSTDDLKNIQNLNKAQLEKINENIIRKYNLGLDTYEDIKTSEQLTEQAKNYKALGESLQKEIEAGTFDTTKNGPMLADYIRFSYLVTSGTIGGAIAYNINSNNNQYVDVLTKEQYYRLCGTQRDIIEAKS